MTELTPAASLAWKIGAAEANAARHKFIERGHFLIGLLSLSKVVHDAPPGLELPLKVKEAVARENARVEELLRRLALRSTALRRALRAALGTGTGAADSEARPISRSASLRIAFRRARALAKGAPIDCVHLLAAVLEAPDAPLARALTDTQAQAQDIYKQALASSEAEATNQADVERVLQTELAQLVATLREKHGVSVRITPEAKAFVAEQGSRPAGDTRAAERALQRWVRSPLEALVGSGKLARHSAWELVYDEGGVYWLPDSDAR
jgi:ATP-dependent Clp protease ATP-binding subunit ClpA